MTEHLPEGYTGEMLFGDWMRELYNSVKELGESSPLAFDWDTAMYNNNGDITPGGEPAGSGEGSGAGGSTGAGGAGSGAVVRGRGAGVVPSPLKPAFNVEVGEYVVFATPD